MTTNDGGDGGLPAWAARHLAESGAQVSDTPPRPRARHRVGRRPTPRDPSRLRGWALAAVAVAAAAGTVPLAVSALTREEPPMPRVGTFPVVAPGNLGTEDGRVEARTGRGATTSTDPALAGVLPQVVEPTAAARPLPAVAAPRRAQAPARAPARGGATPTASLAPTTTSTPTSSTTSPTETEPRDDTGEDTEEVDAVTPRDDTGSTPTTTTTTRRPPERDGLLPGLVRGVGDTAGGLLR